MTSEGHVGRRSNCTFYEHSSDEAAAGMGQKGKQGARLTNCASTVQ